MPPGCSSPPWSPFSGTLVLCYSFIYRKKTEFDSTFFIIYFLLAGMMCGMACTYNVLVMLVFLEAATITSAFLILYGRTKAGDQGYVYLSRDQYCRGYPRHLRGIYPL